MARTARGDAAIAPDFETALAELEKIVATMESGQLSLEASLASYRRGAGLLTYCQGQLKAVQDQVKVLEDGLLKDFPADAGAGRGRTSAAFEDDDPDDVDGDPDDPDEGRASGRR